MKMTKQEQRKVTQEMLKILTLWEERQVLVVVDVEETLKWILQKDRCKDVGKSGMSVSWYQFTALLRKLAHQDLIGGGICHAPRVQRHLGPRKSSGCELILLLLLDVELQPPHIDLPRFCQLPSDVLPHAPFTP